MTAQAQKLLGTNASQHFDVCSHPEAAGQHGELILFEYVASSHALAGLLFTFDKDYTLAPDRCPRAVGPCDPFTLPFAPLLSFSTLSFYADIPVPSLDYNYEDSRKAAAHDLISWSRKPSLSTSSFGEDRSLVNMVRSTDGKIRNEHDCTLPPTITLDVLRKPTSEAMARLTSSRSIARASLVATSTSASSASLCNVASSAKSSGNGSKSEAEYAGGCLSRYGVSLALCDFDPFDAAQENHQYKVRSFPAHSRGADEGTVPARCRWQCVCSGLYRQSKLIAHRRLERSFPSPSP